MVRSLLFVGWMAVLWGSLLMLALAWTAVTQGLGPALAALLPGRSDGWAWVNLVCAVLAVCVWTLVAVVRSRLDRG
jgi:hypothetical protein